MDYLYFGAAILASFHALTYGLWEKQQGNPAGARFVYALAALCVLLPLYRIMAGP